jgi:hypothetical protein
VAPQVLGALVRRFAHFDAAEDAVSGCGSSGPDEASATAFRDCFLVSTSAVTVDESRPSLLRRYLPILGWAAVV